MLVIVYLRQLVRMPVSVAQRHLLYASLVLIQRALETHVAWWLKQGNL
jgi:hypothetical protein